jgi:exosortase
MGSQKSNLTHITASPFTLFVLLWIASLLLFWASIPPLLQQWAQTDQSLGHSPLLFILISWWMWSCRQQFDESATAPPAMAAGAVGLISVGWFVVSLGDIELLEQLLLIPMLLALAALTAGWRSARLLIAPAFMLIFCLPLFDSLNAQLVDLASWSVGGMLQLTSLTSFISGNTITLPAGAIIIADGCSGLRYLVIGLATANLAASMNRLGGRDHLVLNVIAVAAMLCVNWVRILIIVLVAYVTDMQSPLVRNHEEFGWVVFAFGLLPVIFYARRCEDRMN